MTTPSDNQKSRNGASRLREFLRGRREFELVVLAGFVALVIVLAVSLGKQIAFFFVLGSLWGLICMMVVQARDMDDSPPPAPEPKIFLGIDVGAQDTISMVAMERDDDGTMRIVDHLFRGKAIIMPGDEWLAARDVLAAEIGDSHGFLASDLLHRLIDAVEKVRYKDTPPTPVVDRPEA